MEKRFVRQFLGIVSSVLDKSDLRLASQARRVKTPEQSGNALLLRDDLQKRDQEELEKRRADINKILDAPAVDGAPDHLVRDKVDRQIAWIWKMALAHCAHAWMMEVFNTWRLEMSDLNGRMRNHWTRVEKISLVSLLARFEKVLRRLLQPLPGASAYAPAPRQAADPTRVIELFVSGVNFAPGFCTQRSFTAISTLTCAAQVERQVHHVQGRELQQDRTPQSKIAHSASPSCHCRRASDDPFSRPTPFSTLISIVLCSNWPGWTRTGTADLPCLRLNRSVIRKRPIAFELLPMLKGCEIRSTRIFKKQPCVWEGKRQRCML